MKFAFCHARGFGLRSAHAYILVYDVTSPKVTIRYLSIFEEKITLSEFYVPPIPAGANCNFSGPQ